MTTEELLQAEIDSLKVGLEQQKRDLELWTTIANLWKEFGSAILEDAEAHNDDDIVTLVEHTRTREDEIVKEMGS